MDCISGFLFPVVQPLDDFTGVLRTFMVTALGLCSHFTQKTKSPWPLHFKHSHWQKIWSPSKSTLHYAQGTNGVCECKDRYKVHMDSYMTSNGSCFMVTWSILKNALLEVGLTQNRETMALRTLTIYSIVSCLRTHMNKNSLKLAFAWEPNHIWLHTTPEGPWPHYMILKVCWGRPLDTYLLGSRNLKVTALGSCVKKWPLEASAPLVVDSP